MKPRLHPAILLLLIVAAATAARADIKITTRSTAMGRSSQSTVYIKGARQRSESGDNVTLMQCDKRRMVMLDSAKKTFTIMPLGAGAAADVAQQAAAARMPSGTSRKGGLVTITSANTDTGERQKMFGYDARHIRSAMTMQSSPDACYPMNMKMESDGWYADLSPQLRCASAPMMGGAMGAAGRPDCVDQHSFHSTGVTRLGYPLKVTTTMAMPGGMNMSTTTEVTDLSNATLPDSLFEIPPDYRQVGMYNRDAVGQAAQDEGDDSEGEEAAPAPKAAPAAAAPAPAAPAVPAKATGAVRVGVVMPKDITNQSLPTDNLRDLLMGEIRNRQVEAVPLDATDKAAIEEEAKSKDCDYILYTDLAQLDQGPEAKLPAQFHAIAVSGQGDYLGRVDWQLYRTGKALAQWKATEAARAADLPVNAVGDSVIKEAGDVVEEIQHPHKPAPAATPAHRPGKK